LEAITVTSQDWLSKVGVRDIVVAIEQIKTGQQRMPARGAMTWCIQFQEVAYPTNCVLSLAVKSATGGTFVPDTRKGGKEIIKALEKMLARDFRFRVVFRQAGDTNPEDSLRLDLGAHKQRRIVPGKN
jgi:hypothetical protein